MAAIGSIRKRSGLLIAVIAVSLLLFLLSDFLGKQNFGAPDYETNVGYVKGEPITQTEFAQRLELAIQNSGGSVSEQQRASIRNRVWEQFIRERVLDTELDNVGVFITKDELYNELKNPKPGSVLYSQLVDQQTGQVYEQFRNPQTGMIDGDKVLMIASQIMNSDNSQQWVSLEKEVKEGARLNKYFTMLKSGITATSTEAKKAFENRSATYSFNYVVKEYSSIPDDQITITDADLQAYYNQHKDEKRFQQKTEQRDIKFVVFEMTPSAEDIADINAEMAALMTPFASDTNDTAFFLENSDRRENANIEYKTAETIDPQIKDTVMNASIGSVFGPYQQGEYVLISKLTDTKSTPDSAQARHIFIQANMADTNEVAKAEAKLDSIKSVISKKKNFAEMAQEFSDDLGSSANGGDLGDWVTIQRNDIPRELVNAVLDGKKGDMEVVKSQSGVHLYEITDQTARMPRFLLVTVDHKIEPSKATSDKAYKDATQFSIEHKTRAQFEAANENTVVLVAQNVALGSKNLGRVPNAEEIVRWAFNAEAGEVSEPKETETSFVVAMVDVIKPKGTLPLEAVKETIRPVVMNELKAKKIIADMGSYASLDEASTKLDSPIRSINNVNFEANVLPNGLGRELSVLGAAAAMEVNAMSKPIEGNRGVFVITLMGSTPAPAEVDLAIEKRQLTSTLANRVDQSAYEALKEVSGIEDNRALFY